MIVSFAWTIEPLLAGKKTCTRRRWADRYYDQWVRAWRAGRHIHDAYDHNPRVGGHKIGTIELTCEPYHEILRDMPLADLAAEGGLCASREQFIALFDGRPEMVVTVLRFEFSATT